MTTPTEINIQNESITPKKEQRPLTTREKLERSLIEGNVPYIVMQIMTLGLEMGTSDVHIEPREHTVLIRFRVDGRLTEIIQYPATLHTAISSRFKILANLKIDETRKPQDGRVQMTTENRQILEARFSSLPTIHGEKICMRIQDKNKSIPTLEQLGITGNSYKFLQKTINNPNGMFLVTGPTGSGKTTTLYACLAILNKPEINIMTLEDPVEYEMDGLSQSLINANVGYNFSDGLRTALRQDPDIIMVGEIRDQETIEIAIKAALTGHMLLSTLHTNSAAATITRILDMGVKDYKITAALTCIEAQRLMRRVCGNCKEEYIPDESIQRNIKEVLSKVHESQGFDKSRLEGEIKLWRGKGCDKCGGKGSTGRVGIYEVLYMSREIEEVILNGARESEIEDVAISQGMVTLAQDAFIKVIDGVSPIEEAFKVVSGGH